MKAIRYVPKGVACVTLVVPQTSEQIVVKADGYEATNPYTIARLDMHPYVERAAVEKGKKGKSKKDVPLWPLADEGAKTADPESEDMTP